MKRLMMITMLFSCLWLVGCNPAGAEPTAEVSDEATVMPETAEDPTATAVPATPTEENVSPETADDPNQAVIIFKRTGGFAGREDEWTIYADGHVDGSEGARGPLTTDELDQILAEADNIGFFEMKNEYIDKDHCCDFYNYEVTIQAPDGRSNTITTAEQTPSLPPELAQLIQDINNLLSAPPSS